MDSKQHQTTQVTFSQDKNEHWKQMEHLKPNSKVAVQSSFRKNKISAFHKGFFFLISWFNYL